jgi:hypothetical protein
MLNAIGEGGCSDSPRSEGEELDEDPELLLELERR